MRNHKYVPVCFISCETLLHLKFPVSYKFEGTQNTKLCYLSLIYMYESCFVNLQCTIKTEQVHIKKDFLIQAIYIYDYFST